MVNQMKKYHSSNYLNYNENEIRLKMTLHYTKHVHQFHTNSNTKTLGKVSPKGFPNRGKNI